MGTVTKSICAAAALLLAALPARADDGKCHLYRVTSVDMGIEPGGRMTVPMTVSGQPVTMLVDTGGVNTMLTGTVATSMGLHQMHIAGNVRLTVYGGTAIDHYTEATDIEFGRLKTPQMEFLVMPDGLLQGGVGGLLAPDILRAYDDDFDFANAKFTLFSPDHCPGLVVYWTKNDYAKIDIRLDDIGHIEVPVTIDGQEVRFTFDTGASRSVMSLELAERLFKIDEKSPDLKPMSPDDKNYKYPFKTLTFGGGDTGAVTVNNPDIILVPDAVSKTPGREGNLLGMNVLRQLHLYIAYREHHIFVSPAAAH